MRYTHTSINFKETLFYHIKHYIIERIVQAVTDSRGLNILNLLSSSEVSDF